MTATEANAIKTLKRFYGDRLFVPVAGELESELMGGNDRSAIITVAAMVDSGLEYLIAINLPRLATADQAMFSDAFRHDGALGTFSSRIDMAYYKGLIDDQLHDWLHDLRHIRNAVAHTRRKVSFKDAQLQNAAKRLS